MQTPLKEDLPLDAAAEFSQDVSLAVSDLRDALRRVKSFSDLLLRRHVDGPARRLVTALADDAGRIWADINALEEYVVLARSVCIAPISSTDVIDDVCRTLRRELAPFADGGRVFIDDAGFELQGDRALLARGLRELVRNAITHGAQPDPDRARVIIRCGWLETFAWFEVSDAGPGVPESDIDQLFHLLRLKRPNIGGRGRGLAIAARVARLHGGRLALQPSEVGARFRMLIPHERSS